MSVADRYVVDHITRSETGDQYTLVMVEDRPLDAPGLVEETLQKVNEYLQIIASGAFVREVPEASGAALKVQYNVLDDPESSPLS